MATLDINALESFGFRLGDGGTHLARTMMLGDVSQVFLDVGERPSREEVREAVDSENLLGKPSGESRRLAARHLLNLYSFDSGEVIYRAFAFLWKRSAESHPLLALLNAYARDAILRDSAPFIVSMSEGDLFVREKLQEHFEQLFPDRFSEAMLKSAAQNLGGTWTQSGHLQGHRKKFRNMVRPTPGAITFALLLGYLNGNRGILNFESEYVKLLDCSPTTAIEQAKVAARRGWIDVKHVGSVIEVAFPRILTEQELEAIREQG